MIARIDREFLLVALVAGICAGCASVPIAPGSVVQPRQPIQSVPLLAAAENGDTAALVALLDDGADVDTKYDNGWTALMLAANVGSADAVRLLLERGANVNARSISNETPLMFAADTGQTEIVRILLTAGADVHSRDWYGREPLVYAAAHAALDSTRRLFDNGFAAALVRRPTRGTNASPVARPLRAKQGNKPETIMTLLTAGADVNTASDEGETPLMMCAVTQDVESARVLIARGADLDARRKPAKYGKLLYSVTPLTLSAPGPSSDMMKLLLEAGADVNLEAPLIEASWNPSKVQLLLEHHAEPNVRNNLGQTALMIAAKQPVRFKVETSAQQAEEIQTHAKVLQLLLDAGADQTIRDADGRTAADYAGNDPRWPMRSALARPGLTGLNRSVVRSR